MDVCKIFMCEYGEMTESGEKLISVRRSRIHVCLLTQRVVPDKDTGRVTRVDLEALVILVSGLHVSPR